MRSRKPDQPGQPGSYEEALSRAVTAKKCTKKRDARAELLFCPDSTNCFFEVLVVVAVVVS